MVLKETKLCGLRGKCVGQGRSPEGVLEKRLGHPICEPLKGFVQASYRIRIEEKEQ